MLTNRTRGDEDLAAPRQRGLYRRMREGVLEKGELRLERKSNDWSGCPVGLRKMNTKATRLARRRARQLLQKGAA